MATEIVMPKLGLTMLEGIIVKWKKSEGDLIKKTDILYEIETDKVVTEVEAGVNGILKKIIVKEGIKVPVGTIVAIITDVDEEIPDKFNNDRDLEIPKKLKTIYGKESNGINIYKKKLASPAVRKLAMENNIDLKFINGSGPSGRIIKEDIFNYIEQKNKKIFIKKQEKYIQIKGIRKIVSDHVSKSSRETASVTLMVESDFSKIKNLKEKFELIIERELKTKLSYTDFIIWAVSQTLERHPNINVSFENNNIRFNSNINLGIAVDTKDGLLVPVIKNANKKTFVEIVKARFKLVEKARNGNVCFDDLQGNTFTITNMGMLGIDYFTPIINLPEVATLGVGSIKDKIIVEKHNNFSIKPIIHLSLTFDHRLIDGVPAARFLRDLIDTINNPEKLEEIQ